MKTKLYYSLIAIIGFLLFSCSTTEIEDATDLFYSSNVGAIWQSNIEEYESFIDSNYSDGIYCYEYDYKHTPTNNITPFYWETFYVSVEEGNVVYANERGGLYLEVSPNSLGVESMEYWFLKVKDLYINYPDNYIFVEYHPSKGYITNLIYDEFDVSRNEFIRIRFSIIHFSASPCILS